MGYQPGYPMVAAASMAPEGPAPSPKLRGWHLAASIAAPVTGVLGIGLIVLAMTLGEDQGRPVLAALIPGAIALALAVIGGMATLVLRSIWFYRIWRWIPRDARHTRRWANMAPEFAAFGHWIPYFNLYWYFAAPLATCDAFDALSAQYTPTAPPSPRTAAVVGAIAHLIAFPIAPFFDYLFFKQIDQMAERIEKGRQANPAGVVSHFAARPAPFG